MIRLFIAAPSEVLRAGLESLVQARGTVELAGSTSDPRAVESRIQELLPDVVLAADPSEDLLDLAGADGAPPMVVLTDDAAQALRHGARAALPREASAHEILAAVEAAAAGLVVLHPQDLRSALSLQPPLASGASGQALSPREIEVLRMLADGLGNKTIAWKLGISEHTVKFHVASIMNKLNAGSRTEAVTIGIRRGLVPV